MRMASVLAVAAALHPAVYDLIRQDRPASIVEYRSGTEQGPGRLVALNPQPLPPSPPDQAELAGVRLAQQLVQIAVASEVTGDSSSQFVRETIDEWCGTPPWPHKFPSPFPPTGPQGSGPHPDPWLVGKARLAGAMVLADAGSRIHATELHETLLKASDQLLEAVVAGTGSVAS